MIGFNRTALPCSLLVAIATTLLTTAPAGAQDFAACRKILDDKERLACFDSASQNADTPAGNPAAAAPAAAPSAAAPAARPPVTNFNPFASFGLDTPPPTKPEDFGRSSMPVTAPAPPVNPEEPPPIRSIAAKVLQIVDPDGKPKFVLDNKQVWMALNYININPHSDRPNTVTIESSLVGYLMRLNDSSAEFIVKRLK